MAATSLPIPVARQRFRRQLLTWYRAHGRELPWRQTSDPYHILVSEIMLQQTQVDRVLPKYLEWLDKYPSLAALADAAEDDVVQTWRPLGYNIRPRRLQSIARESVTRYGGQLPSDHETLLSFKGIGAYTAGAIRSFAFGQRAGDPGHQRRTRAVSGVRRPRRHQGAQDAQAAVGSLGERWCRTSTSSTSTRRSWISARRSARRGSRSAMRVR
jgi:hypothetical protein